MCAVLTMIVFAVCVGVSDGCGLWGKHQRWNHEASLPVTSPGILDAQTSCLTTVGLSFHSVKSVWNLI